MGLIGLPSVSSAVSSAGIAISNAAGSAASTEAAANQPSNGHFLDTLFLRDQPDTNISSPDARAEAGRIIARAVANGSLDPNDRAYLAKLVAARTGISQQGAEKRVDGGMNQISAAADKAKAAADAERKASAKASFYFFFSMLIGAFIASAAGAVGGRQRDAF